jgi:hypothetical protein
MLNWLRQAATAVWLCGGLHAAAFQLNSNCVNLVLEGPRHACCVMSYRLAHMLVEMASPLICPCVLHVLQAMSITVSTTTLVEPASAAASTQQTQQQPQQQTSRRHVQAGPRRGVPRPPDPAAAVRWQDEQGIPPDDVPLEGISATTKKVVQLQPRIRADPYMQAQRLAGWVRLGVEGAPEAAGDAGFQDEAGMDVDQPGDEEQAADDDDFIDEEWV